MKLLNKNKKNLGFTIVELLVVIVVIGILAALTAVTYTGITSRARAAALQADLKQSATQLEIYHLNSGTFPVDTSILSASNDTTYDYNLIDGTYYLTASSSNLAYCITSINPTPVEGECVLPAPYFVTVDAGDYHGCSVASDSNIYCWGYNSYGQLGDNSTTNGLVPVAVNTSGVLSGKTINSVTSGGYHTCAIDSDGHLYCWGRNNYGQLGNSSFTNSLVPVAVNTSGVLSGKTITSVSGSSTHTCALDSDGYVYCWGDNSRGELGNNSTATSSVPVAVNTSGALNGKTVLAISVGYYHTCAVASDNKAYCWGYDTYGQLGDNSTTDSSVPVAVDTSGVLSGKTITAIEANSLNTCALADNVYCWGNNNYGQLGNNSTSNSLIPVAVYTSGVLNGKTVETISGMGAHVCALTSDNGTYCWGFNTYGQLGNNSTTHSSIPVAIDTSGVLNGKTITAISMGGNHSCSIASDHNIYCWGRNSFGQLGNNSTTNSSVPVQTSSLE